MIVSKNFDKSLLTISCFILVLIGTLYTIAINSFEKGKFTCNKYLLNTYLYILLTFNLLIIINLVLEHNKIVLPLSLPRLIALLFINIGIIVYYLLIRKIFSFVSADYLRVTDDVYTHTPPMTKSATSNLPKAPAINPKLSSSETSISTPVPVPVPVPTIISKTSVTPQISNNNPNNQTNTSL